MLEELDSFRDSSSKTVCIRRDVRAPAPPKVPEQLTITKTLQYANVPESARATPILSNIAREHLVGTSARVPFPRVRSRAPTSIRRRDSKEQEGDLHKNIF